MLSCASQLIVAGMLIILTFSNARAENNLSACTALLTHGLRDVVSSDVRQALRQQTFRKLCKDDRTLKEEVNRHIKDYELDIAAAADFIGYGGGSFNLGTKDYSDEQRRLMTQHAAKFCSESSASSSEDRSLLSQASNINAEATRAWLDCIRILHPQDNLRTELQYLPDEKGFVLSLAVNSAANKLTGISAEQFNCKVNTPDGKTINTNEAKFPIVLTSQAVSIRCERQFKTERVGNGIVNRAPASLASFFLDSGPLGITFRATAIPDYPFATFAEVANRLASSEREIARLSAALAVINTQGVQFAKKSDYATNSEWSDKARMLRARDDNHFMRFLSVGADNSDQFQILRTTDNTWHNTLGLIRDGANVGILAKVCPSGWTDKGYMGVITHNSNPALYDKGAPLNEGWSWVHPRFCIR